MAKKIGKTFPKELKLAGLLGLAFSWGADGSMSLDKLTPQDSAAVQAVYDAHDPDATLPAPPNLKLALQDAIDEPSVSAKIKAVFAALLAREGDG